MYTLVQGSLGLGEEEERCATYALESLLWFGDVGGLLYDALALAMLFWRTLPHFGAWDDALILEDL